MIMKKTILLIAAVFFAQGAFAQNVLGELDDLGMIEITSYLPDTEDYHSEAVKSLLMSKMQNIVVSNGLGGGVHSRFIITSYINLLQEEVTATMPPMHALTLGVNFYIGDGYDGVLYSIKTVQVKGVGNSPQRAYTNAIRSIRTDQGFQDFVEKGKRKIIEYYNTQCPYIQKEAQTLASRHEFDRALLLLSSVPTVCRECYMSSMDLITTIYEAKINFECDKIMSAAKTFQSLNQYEEAAFTLATIIPGSKCFEQAQSMIAQIEDLRYKEILGKARGAWAARNVEETAYYLGQIPEGTPYAQSARAIGAEVKAWVKEKDNREWNLVLKQFDHQKHIDVLRMEVAMEAAKRLPREIHYHMMPYNVSRWW
jgi:hypothetical protein